MQGSPAQINAWVKQASVIYSRLFHWPCVTGARGGGGGDGGVGGVGGVQGTTTVCAQPGLHYRSKSTGVGLQGLQT